MRRSGGVSITGEGTDTTGVVLRALLGKEAKVTPARCFKFTVGHGENNNGRVWRRT
jgi:hypothetical protein